MHLPCTEAPAMFRACDPHVVMACSAWRVLLSESGIPTCGCGCPSLPTCAKRRAHNTWGQVTLAESDG